MPQQPRLAYFILDTEKDADGNFIPCIAKEWEPGYSRTSWNYGKDRDLAEETVETLNLRIGITEKDAAVIVATTMRNPHR